MTTPTFTPDAAAPLAPTGNWMSLRRPFKKRTSSGWRVATLSGVCPCGKQFAAGNEIAFCHGKVSGCYWCCREVKPTAGDVAAFCGWRAEVLASNRHESLVAYLAAIPASYREMISAVSFVQGLA